MKQKHNYYFDTDGALIAALPYGSRVYMHPACGAGFIWENRAPLGAGFNAWHRVAEYR